MPDITPVALSDIALASSTANAVSVSRGAGQVPLADPNFAWNPTAKQQVLKGQAIGTGGDRWNIQASDGTDLINADQNGMVNYRFPDAISGNGGFQTVNVDDGYNGNVAFSTLSFANNGTDPHPDIVLAVGHNTNGTNLLNPSLPGISTNTESYYVPTMILGGTPQFEYHAAQVHYTDGTIKRPWSVSIPYDQSAIAHAITMSTLSWLKLDNTQAMLWTWPTLELLNGTTVLQNVNNLAWLNQRATDGSTNISLALVDSSNRTVFGQSTFAAYLPGSSVTIAGPLYALSNVGVGTTSPNVSGQSGNVRVVTSSGTDTGGFGGFEVNSLSTSVDALLGYYGYTASGQNAGSRLVAYHGTWLEGSTAGKLGGSLRFFTQADGGALTEAFRVSSTQAMVLSGTLQVGGGAPLKKLLSATAVLDFPSTAAGTSSDLTISVTGAAVGDSVALGLPASPPANTSFTAWVSGANTVTVRFNNYSSSAVDPTSGTYRATVTSF